MRDKKHADEDPGDDADQDALTASLLEVLEDAVGLARMPHEPIHWSFEEFKEGVIEDLQSVIESSRVGNDPLMEKADGVFRFGLQGLAEKSNSEDRLEKLSARYDEVRVLLAKRDAGSA